MNQQERTKQFTDAMRFVERYERPDVSNESVALVLISAALAPLGWEAQRRVMKWAADRFKVSLS